MSAEHINNWVTEETNKQFHKQALKLVKERHKYEKGKKFKMIPHPTIRRTWIMKEVK